MKESDTFLLLKRVLNYANIQDDTKPLLAW